MRRFLLVATAAILAAVVVLVIVIATQPSTFRVERTAVLDAPAPAVFAQIDDFRNWQNWSPWAKLDPTMSVTYDGPPTGIGSVYHWAGDNQVGEGQATIVESRPNERVRVQLDFVEPIAATNTAEFALKPEGDKTGVTWSIAGENGFMAKAVHLVMDVDAMIGGMFEQGLKDIEAAAQAAPQP